MYIYIYIYTYICICICITSREDHPCTPSDDGSGDGLGSIASGLGQLEDYDIL